jgi:hypothetical protein
MVQTCTREGGDLLTRRVKETRLGNNVALFIQMSLRVPQEPGVVWTKKGLF